MADKTEIVGQMLVDKLRRAHGKGQSGLKRKYTNPNGTHCIRVVIALHVIFTHSELPLPRAEKRGTFTLCD